MTNARAQTSDAKRCESLQDEIVECDTELDKKLLFELTEIHLTFLLASNRSSSCDAFRKATSSDVLSSALVGNGQVSEC